MIVAAKTHKGLVRDKNEDCFFIDDIAYRLFVVADGMGGHKAGEIASREAVQIIKEELLSGKTENSVEETMKSAFQKANKKIYDMASDSEEMEGMGTTLTVMYVADHLLHFAHIGDSRAYFIGDQALEQITTDHTLVEQLILNGTLSRKEAATHPNRNVITKAVGVDKTLSADYYVKNNDNKRVLICSDGLTDSLNDEEIFEIISRNATASDAANALVEQSNQKGGHDNITVVLIDFNEKVREVEA
ncbi:MAG: Stp1/IreP family PP2C-type Ser/Thr phosphatase [Clostridia bacterium]|nr:Stp1/IreP family PP2C-type Ser/Thr phosphatase [Clostridia bacterium]